MWRGTALFPCCSDSRACARSSKPSTSSNTVTTREVWVYEQERWSQWEKHLVRRVEEPNHHELEKLVEKNGAQKDEEREGVLAYSNIHTFPDNSKPCSATIIKNIINLSPMMRSWMVDCAAAAETASLESTACAVVEALVEKSSGLESTQLQKYVWSSSNKALASMMCLHGHRKVQSYCHGNHWCRALSDVSVKMRWSLCINLNICIVCTYKCIELHKCSTYLPCKSGWTRTFRQSSRTGNWLQRWCTAAEYPSRRSYIHTACS